MQFLYIKVHLLNKDFMDRIINETSPYYRQNSYKASTSQQMGWRDGQAQIKRFQALLRFIPTDSCFSINDLGCGNGSLYEFMCCRNWSKFDYIGYDILKDMISLANMNHKGINGCRFTLIDSPSEMLVSDYTAASGIFNLKNSNSESNWLDYIKTTILTMAEKSRRGFSFNCLTKYSEPEKMKTNLFYSDPGLLLDFIAKNVSKNIIFDHDYGEFDFTISVRF